MILKRLISYTYSWRETFYIALLLGGLLAGILILLQPFDTYTSVIAHKHLKLSGYAFCIVIPALTFHLFENYWYRQQGLQWFLWNELIIMLLNIVAVITCAYFYNTYVINKVTPSWNYGLGFFLGFGLPVACLMLPVWIYLRFKFGKVNLQRPLVSAPLLTIRGENAEDELQMTFKDFIMAQAQQNYVDLYFLNVERQVQKKVLRSTLANLSEQLPKAHRVHRSYLLNLDYVEAVRGNARKRALAMRHLEEEVPVSAKYYAAIRDHLQIRPEKG